MFVDNFSYYLIAVWYASFLEKIDTNVFVTKNYSETYGTNVSRRFNRNWSLALFKLWK